MNIFRFSGIATAAMLSLGITACDDSSPTSPDDVADSDAATAESVLRNETLTQVDRMGFPAINTAVVIDSDAKDLFNASAPSGDTGFIRFAAQQLNEIYAVPLATGEAVAGLLLPDILTLDGPVFQGRRPSDDVIDAILGVLFGPSGVSALAPFPPLASDNVDMNDKRFPDEFPYLAGPHVE